MLTDKLQTLDSRLREYHSELYATLQPGIDARVKHDALRHWFAWKDGQDGGSAPFGGELFFGWHRFVPFAEGQHDVRAARRALWTNPIYAIFTLTVGRQLLRSWPLLIDASGAGYYFDTGKDTVLYRVEGDPDMYFSSFEQFVDFLAELSSSSVSEHDFLEAESRLHRRYKSASA